MCASQAASARGGRGTPQAAGDHSGQPPHCPGVGVKNPKPQTLDQDEGHCSRAALLQRGDDGVQLG